MANKKISDLDPLTTPAGADIIAIVDQDASPSATTKKVTATNLMTLAPVQSVAGQTGTVTLSNTDISGLGTAATANTGTSANNVVQLDGTAKLPAVDGSQLTGISADVDGPLTIALRGTDNPHIGAFPQQSFKVMDNPTKSAMVIADADGNVTYVLKDTTSQVKVKAGSNAASRFALASDLPAFVLENDTGEPDIEVTEPNTGEKISVISGDSDTKGANGLPTRQGYNIPDIGANPAPLLISGGSIA
jgi:hypothetical protein